MAFRWPWQHVGDNGWFSSSGAGTNTDPRIPHSTLVDSLGDDVGAADNPFVIEDHSDAIADGDVDGAYVVNVDGYRASLSSGDGFVDLTEITGVTVIPLPLTAIAMIVVSTTANDTAGTEVSAGTATGGSATTLIDSAATFITDGVAIGDKLFNTTNIRGSVITSVDSEIQVTTNTFEAGPNNIGDTYSIRTAFGTGSHVVEFHGLDSTWVTQSEAVFLNGTAPVTLANTYLRINNMHTMDGDTSTLPTVADGDITLENVGRTITYDVVKAEGNQDLHCHFTVPLGKKATIEGWTPSMATTKKDTLGRIILRSTVDWQSRTLIPGVYQFERVMVGAESSLYSDSRPHVKFPAKADIKASAQVTLGTGIMTAGANIRMVLEDE